MTAKMEMPISGIFGDGNTSTEEEPIYQYTEPGSYEVQLVVYDTGCSSDSVTLIVDIGAFSGGVVDPVTPICLVNHTN